MLEIIMNLSQTKLKYYQGWEYASIYSQIHNISDHVVEKSLYKLFSVILCEKRNKMQANKITEIHVGEWVLSIFTTQYMCISFSLQELSLSVPLLWFVTISPSLTENILLNVLKMSIFGLVVYKYLLLQMYMSTL